VIHLKKRSVHIAICLIFLITLTACSRDHQGGIEAPRENGNPAADVAVSQEKDTHPIAIPPHEQIRLDVLADFDFLVEELESNMPLYGVIYRRLGVDLAALLEGVRVRILTEDMFAGALDHTEQMERAAADFLFAALHGLQLELRGIGHLRPKSHALYVDTLVELKRMVAEDPAEHSAIQLSRMEAFTHPAALWFYGVDLDELDVDDERLGLFGTDPFAVQTSIISPGEVALISIRHSFNNLDFDRAKLFPFFEEIQDYAHLIIDLSEHLGGSPNHFRDLIISPLLSAPISIEGHQFFMDRSRIHLDSVDTRL